MSRQAPSAEQFAGKLAWVTRHLAPRRTGWWRIVPCSGRTRQAEPPRGRSMLPTPIMLAEPNRAL